MRLDAARLKGCFISCFRRSCYQKSKVFRQGLPKNPHLSAGFSFLRRSLRPVDPGSGPLDPENVEFFALKPFSGQIAPFSRSKSRRADRPEGADRARATGSFRGRSTPEQTLRPRTAKRKGSHHSTMGGILQALDLGQELLRG